MKKLMFAAVAAAGLAAFAQEQQVPVENPRRAMRGSMVAERGMPPRGGMAASGMTGDLAVRAAMDPRVAAKVGIPKEVQQQIRKMDLDSRKVIRDIQHKTREAMEKQAKLMKEQKIDEAAVMAAIDEVFELRKEMAKAQTKQVIAVKSLLTPEQLDKALEEMKAARAERRSRRISEINASKEKAEKEKAEKAAEQEKAEKKPADAEKKDA